MKCTVARGAVIVVRDLGNARREPSRITDSPNSPPFSSKRKSNSPSLHCRAVDISVGSSGKPTCLGFCDRRLPPPSFANSASTFSFFLPSCSSRNAALSRCSATRVAGHQRLSFSGVCRISAMSFSSGARSLASDTFRALSMSTPSRFSSFRSCAVISGNFCVADIRSLGVTSFPSSFFRLRSVATTNARYPPKSQHGFPIKYKSVSL
mmetsp:Transcript_1573/g.5407  ORF Transcript_1573/g.5407 Transcript_1573/m.5407 type:complete len:208 (+) Transcript_1573:1077-1700(+)